MVNDYASDAIKDKARFEIYKFADKHFPKDRSNLTALYMASTNNRESFWLDKLGIRRENRVILESNSSKIEQVKAANPGVTVLDASTHDLFDLKEFEGYEWSYMGLDYECTLNRSVLSDLHNIASKGLLTRKGIIYTNVVGMREQTEAKEDYMLDFLGNIDSSEQAREIFGLDFDYYRHTEQIAEEMKAEGIPEQISKELKSDESLPIARRAADIQMKRMLRFMPKEKLDKVRSYAINRTIQYTLIQEFLRIRFIDASVPGIQGFIRSHDNPNYESGYEAQHREGYVIGLKIGTIVDRIMEGMEKRWEKGPHELDYKLEKFCIEYFRKQGLITIPLMVKEAATRGYSATDQRSFYYISSRNTRMMLDIFHVQRLDPIVNNTLNELVDNDITLYYNNGKLYIGDFMNQSSLANPSVLDELSQQKRKYQKLLNNRVGHLIPLHDLLTSTHIRKNLGSSYKPALRKATARKCILDGMTNDEIAERYQVGNWGTVSAIRANVTKGFITKPKPKYKPKKEKPKQIPLPGSRFLVSRKAYRDLPDEYRLRIRYFRDEVLEQLSTRKQRNIRQAFAESKLEKMLKEDIFPIRFYAFLDDISSAISKKKRITPQYITKTFVSVRDAKSLTTVVEYKPEPMKPIKKEPSEKIKKEVRELAAGGIPKDDIWEEYKGYFSSRQQFGAVTAWASPKLAKRRKK